jgi:hypothetical protein
VRKATICSLPLELGDAVLRNPMSRCGGCCAASGIGQAAMVKAMSDSSVNRLIGRLIGRAALYHDPTFPVARFGAVSDDQRLKYCVDPAMKVFHGRIVGQDQIYVVCAIEHIRDLPNGFLIRATLPERQPPTYALGRCLNGADDAQGRHARAAAFRDRAKATALFFRSERAHGDDELVRRKGICDGVRHCGVGV